LLVFLLLAVAVEIVTVLICLDKARLGHGAGECPCQVALKAVAGTKTESVEFAPPSLLPAVI
jgi:hypothetical protein